MFGETTEWPCYTKSLHTPWCLGSVWYVNDGRSLSTYIHQIPSRSVKRAEFHSTLTSAPSLRAAVGSKYATGWLALTLRPLSTKGIIKIRAVTLGITASRIVAPDARPFSLVLVPYEWSSESHVLPWPFFVNSLPCDIWHWHNTKYLNSQIYRTRLQFLLSVYY